MLVVREKKKVNTVYTFRGKIWQTYVFVLDYYPYFIRRWKGSSCISNQFLMYLVQLADKYLRRDHSLLSMSLSSFH